MIYKCESSITFQGSVPITLNSLFNPGFNDSPINIIKVYYGIYVNRDAHLHLHVFMIMKSCIFLSLIYS